MNSFREKFGLRLTDAKETDNDCCIKSMMSSICGSDSSDHTTPLEGCKKRADTAETETSFQLQKDCRQEDLRLVGIGSYDEDECVIWYDDSLLSLSGDDNDHQHDQPRHHHHLTISPLDTDRVFVEAETMLATQSKSTNLVPEGRLLRRHNKNGGEHKARSFFPSGILLPSVARKSDFFSRTTKSSHAAKSRKFFSLCKVPASIAEEPCSTPSNASAPFSP